MAQHVVILSVLFALEKIVFYSYRALYSININ